MIQVDGLSKRFRGVDALCGVGFTAPDGAITGLIGPNGAGKTTALRVLYTVLRPDSGHAAIDGRDVVAERRAAQAAMGALPDNRGLYPRLTARENVRYYGHLHGIRGRALEHRIAELFALLGMEDIADRRTRGFSRGQTLKVGLARALVHDPPNLLLDEPTNGLDIATSRAMRTLMRERRAAGRCLLYCSHIMSEVADLCDRIVVIDQGRVAAQGTLADLQTATGEHDLEDVFLALTGRPFDGDTQAPPAWSGAADAGAGDAG